MMRAMVSRLPIYMQQELKRHRFRRQIRRGGFTTNEPEFAILKQWLSEGDWAIDIGANVGHYTLRLAELVGRTGRVIAVEPIAETFELLAANVTAQGLNNVTLLNAAASDTSKIGSMTVPMRASGLRDYYGATLDSGVTGTSVMCLRFDGLDIQQRVKLVKVDAEGHEAAVLQGMIHLIERDRPVLIVEGRSAEVADLLRPLGYKSEQLPGSPNVIHTPT